MSYVLTNRKIPGPGGGTGRAEAVTGREVGDLVRSGRWDSRALDATIRLFAPATNRELISAIRPTQRGRFFRQGKQMRLCLTTLREAGGPMSARQVAEYAPGEAASD
jgi:hypothetical protein